MKRPFKKPKSPETKVLKHTHEARPNERCEACEASPIPRRAYDDLIRAGNRPTV